MHDVEIRLEGHLDRQWLDWLGDLAIAYSGQDESILTGQVRDQSELYGLMGKLRDLGVTLISVSFGSQPTGDQINEVSQP